MDELTPPPAASPEPSSPDESIAAPDAAQTTPPVQAPAYVAAGPARAVYATFWRRFWAYQLDVVTVLVLAGAFTLITQGENAPAIVVATWILYFVGFGAEGGTPGKRMFGLRLTRLDGSIPGFGRAALREVIGRPLSAIPLYLGYLWMLDDDARQTWHDRISDTIVLREVAASEGPAWSSSPPWLNKRVKD